ncbi:MAG TPA: PfkB family carbohydrate kinase, partial [Dongiaceae bacterium]
MANTRRGFVTGGTWCVDLNKMIDFWPPEDSIAEIREIDLKGGGSGSNLAIDMKKLDPAMPVETIGIVGDDENGRFLLNHADSFGIDRRQIAVTKELPTQFTDCFGSRKTGRRTHIFYPGAAALLTPDHFNFAQTSGRIFHLGLPGVHKLLDAPWQSDPNGWVTVLKKARAAGMTTNFELVMIEPQRLAGILHPCLPHLDYLVVNDWEIGALAGKATYQEGVTDIAACLEAARHVLTLGSMSLVVVHFPKGALAVARDGTVVRKPSVRVP